MAIDVLKQHEVEPFGEFAILAGKSYNTGRLAFGKMGCAPPFAP
jgi:hypothetical protein